MEPTATLFVTTPTPTQEPVTELPDIEDVQIGSEPLLYDFLCGCLDWHISIHRDTIDSDLYILRHSSSPNILYTDWYIIQSGYTTPPQGSTIERYVLNQRDLDTFESALNNIPDEYKVTHGEWQLIIYAGEAARVLNMTRLTFRSAHRYAEGRVPPFVSDGTGWPTEWLRREPYVSRLRDISAIDMSDSWWDTFSVEGRYDLVPTDEGAQGPTYFAICTGVREFSFCDSSGNVSRGMSWDLLRETCNSLRCDIEGIYEHGTWSEVNHE